MRVVPALLIAAQCLAGSAAVAGTSAGCSRAAIARLHASSPGGYATFTRATDPGSFEAWLDCDDAQFALPTAVHEAIHVETNEGDAFPLVGGGAAARPHETSAFFPPSRLVGQFEADDFTAIYLTVGKASSASDFLYLLDEFNAYTHDLAAAVDLKFLSRPDEGVDHRDGLAAMMAFVSAYAEFARTDEPVTWRGLHAPQVAGVVRRLWIGAERVMASSCGIPRYGTRDRDYLRQVCASGPRSALASILGRPPICAQACLAAPPSAVQDAGDEIAEIDDAAVPADQPTAAPPHPRHPFAVAAAPRRHGAGD